MITCFGAVNIVTDSHRTAKYEDAETIYLKSEIVKFSGSVVSLRVCSGETALPQFNVTLL